MLRYGRIILRKQPTLEPTLGAKASVFIVRAVFVSLAVRLRPRRKGLHWSVDAFIITRTHTRIRITRVMSTHVYMLIINRTQSISSPFRANHPSAQLECTSQHQGLGTHQVDGGCAAHEVVATARALTTAVDNLVV